jgi:hypothetical protein
VRQVNFRCHGGSGEEMWTCLPAGEMLNAQMLNAQWPVATIEHLAFETTEGFLTIPALRSLHPLR